MTAKSTSRVVVPAGAGRAILVGAGQHVAVVDVDGGQVGDLFAFDAADTTEFASASHTRVITTKLFPRPGEAIYSNQRRTMLELEEDTSPRFHDTLSAACDPRRYEMLGAHSSHRSCAGNLAEAMADHGGLRVPVPQPFNIFMDVRVGQGGDLSVYPASSRAGDRLVFCAAVELVVVLSSCPMDLVPISKASLTSLAVEVW